MIIVLTDRRWTFETKVSGVFFVIVPSLGNSRYAPDRPEIRATLTKLWIFGILSLDRVVYVDADCLVLKPIDDLFDLAGLWCAPDYVEEPHSRRFNSGLIAFDPTTELRDKIYGEAYVAQSYDHGDQGLLNSIVWSKVNFLPPEYSVTRHYHFFHGAEMRSLDVRLIHYIVKKPWDLWYRETPDTALNDLDDLWTAELDHGELLALVSQWRRRQFTFERSRLESLHQRRSPIAVALASRRVRYLAAAVVGGILLVLFVGSLALVLEAMAKLR
jgi:glycogenin